MDIQEIKNKIQNIVANIEEISKTVSTLNLDEQNNDFEVNSNYNNFLKIISSKDTEKKDGFTTWNPENYEDITTDEDAKDPKNEVNIINY